MFRRADKTVRRGIRTDSWFSWPPDRVDHYTTWELGPIELCRHQVSGHLDLDRSIEATAYQPWKLTVARSNCP